MSRMLCFCFFLATSACKTDSQPVPATQPHRAVIKVAKPFARIGVPVPAPAEGEPIQVGIDSWAVKLPDGTIRQSTVEHDSDDPTIEGAVSVKRMMREHGDVVDIIQPAITSTNAARAACVVAWQKRGGTVTAQYDWTIGFRLVGDGTAVRIVEIQPLPDRWPIEFDEEIRACYLDSFASITIASERVLDMLIEFPLCVYPETKES